MNYIEIDSIPEHMCCQLLAAGDSLIYTCCGHEIETGILVVTHKTSSYLDNNTIRDLVGDIILNHVAHDGLRDCLELLQTNTIYIYRILQ